METILLTYTDAMAETGFSRSTIWELCRTGELEVVRYGRAVRITRASLEAWIERQRTANSADEVSSAPGGR